MSVKDEHPSEETDGLHLSTMLTLLLLCGVFWVAVCSGILQFLN